MQIKTPHRPTTRGLEGALLSAVLACVLLPGVAGAQGLTGVLFGTVSDAQGAPIPGAVVRLGSPAMIGGATTLTTNERGELRFLSLPPGLYELDITMPGFASLNETDILIGAGATIEKTVVLKLAGVEESVVVQGAGSRIDARYPGVETRFGPEDITTIPTRRASMFDWIRAAPGISPTSPSSGIATTISAFGSGTNENQFLIDGMNTTCPCSGVARTEPGVDFIHEVQISSVGSSAEFGNMQGAVINVVTKQGGERFLDDASYYGQTSALTSQPVSLRYVGPGEQRSGYTRAKYEDFTNNLGGPAIHDRLWFFAGYQWLRDYDSQPGTDPTLPRKYEMQKLFAKLTWRFGPGWQLVQSLHDEIGTDPERPTIVTPFEATARTHVSTPTMNFGDLTHVMSANTLWDVRVGRFVVTRSGDLNSESPTTPSVFDRITGVTTGARQSGAALEISRTTAKATLTHYQRALHAEHEWKVGAQFERGEHQAINFIPTNVRYEYTGPKPFRSISSLPANVGGVSLTYSAFATDTLTLRDRLTVTGGVRFDHSRAISQDLPAVDPQAHETDTIIPGRGTMYTWNLWSPRLGVSTKLSADGRTILKASYGRFFQGVLTGELEPFHRGATAVTMTLFNSDTGDYSGASTRVDPKVNLLSDPEMRAPRTDEYSVSLDRAVGHQLTVSMAYVHKDGSHFISWTDVAGKYVEGSQKLADGRTVTVYLLDTAITPAAARRFLLTNPDGYSSMYDGLVMSTERRWANGWQALASYTWSRAYGLLPSSNASAAGVQSSTVSPPQPSIFGRDPNDLTNARGRLPNDRPHVVRLMGSVAVPRTGLMVSANLQQFSGKPWTAAAQVTLPQGAQRVLLEPRGSHRLSSQTLLDVRLSREIMVGTLGRMDLLLDVLNLLNDAAEESLATETQMTEMVISPTFGQPVSFGDPRRAMLGVRLHLGR